MKSWIRVLGIVIGCVTLFDTASVSAQDWPQWRGPNRDGKVAGFIAPVAWPEKLTQKWKVTVGDGVATPALVGDKIFVFSRQDGNEVTRCIEAATGNEVWQTTFTVDGATGPAARFSGPRSSPTVVDGKIMTLGVRGTLFCRDAATGQVLWQNNDFGNALPRFFTSCSPIVVNGLCIVQLGGEENGGAIVAYDLASGSQKWKWIEDGTAYASPVLLTLDGAQEIVAETANNIVGIGVADGKLLWQVPFAVKGRAYNAATPIVDDTTVIYSGSGRGTKAVKIDKQGDQVTARELWSNAEASVQFNSPVLKNGLVFGISDRDMLFCIKAENNQTAWTARTDGGRGYGSVVDAGSVLIALTPSGKLVVFEPSDKEFKEIASYKVADGDTYAYPVIAGNRVFVKDKDSLTLWTIE